MSSIYFLFPDAQIRFFVMGVTPTIVSGYLPSVTDASGFHIKNDQTVVKFGTTDAGTIYGFPILQGDIIEMKIDRSSGALSFRAFRDGKWLDYGVLTTKSVYTSGDLYFCVQSYLIGWKVQIADEPNEVPTEL